MTFTVLPPVPVENSEDSDFFQVVDITNVPEPGITSSPSAEGPVPAVDLDLPPEAALGPRAFACLNSRPYILNPCSHPLQHSSWVWSEEPAACLSASAS